jgi:hypothetical protein
MKTRAEADLARGDLRWYKRIRIFKINSKRYQKQLFQNSTKDGAMPAVKGEYSNKIHTLSRQKKDRKLRNLAIMFLARHCNMELKSSGRNIPPGR